MAAGFGGSNIFSTGGVTYRQHGQGVSGLDGINIGGTQNEDPDLVYANIFETLIDDLRIVLQAYSLANFKEAYNLLNEGNFKQRVGLELVNIYQDTYDSSFKEKLRSMLTDTFKGLQESLIQYAELQNALTQIEKCRESEAILNDPAKLQEHIENLKKAKYLFDLPPIQSIYATLKPEYARYVELHGFPPGAVFDQGLLTNIRISLGLI